MQVFRSHLTTRWIIVMVFLCTCVRESKQDVKFTKTVDMFSRDCDSQQTVQVTNDDVIQVMAHPPQQQAGVGTRDSCSVELEAVSNRRLRLYVLDVVIYDCGIFIDILEPELSRNIPKRTLNCDSNPGLKYTTAYSGLLINLKKQSSQSVNYKYSIAITTDRGPDVEFEQAAAGFYQDILTDGAVAGIAISASIVLLALILLVIFAIVKLRKKRNEESREASTKAASTGYSGMTFPSRHYSHHDSQDLSSVDTKLDNSYNNTAYKSESPIKSILKTDNDNPSDQEEVRKPSKGYFYRQSRAGSTHSLDKPHLEYTDVSDPEYSDKERSKILAKKKRNSSHRDEPRKGNGRNQSTSDRDRDLMRERVRERDREIERQRQKDREIERERERERSRLRSERDQEKRHHSERSRDHSRHRGSERDYYDGPEDRHHDRERSRGRSRSESERRQDRRERDRSYSPPRRSTNGRSSSRHRKNSTRSQSHDRYSSYSRHKTASNGGRSDYSEESQRHRSTDRSNTHRNRSSSLGNRSDRNRSSLRAKRR